VPVGRFIRHPWAEEERRNCYHCDTYRGYVCAEHRDPSYSELIHQLEYAESLTCDTADDLVDKFKLLAAELERWRDGSFKQAHQQSQEIEELKAQLERARQEDTAYWKRSYSVCTARYGPKKLGDVDVV
jgi:hypothetical protein